MRHILAVVLLGMSLGLGASAALAGDDLHDFTDRLPQQVQVTQVQAPDQTDQAAPAGLGDGQPVHLVHDFEGGR